jgi:hypothetical protein
MKGRMPGGTFGGAVFDAETRRIYVMVKSDNITAQPHARPCVMVLEVK